jgi:3-hydroxybutyryl-CoA dehydrogenase
LLKRGESQSSTGDVLKLITFSEDPGLLERADYVIENATEKWEVKREIYNKIDSICPERCVFAANTSAIPITRIASATKRAQQVIGIHFMNPVPMKNTVEVILGHHTSAATIDTTSALLAKMGKEWVLVNDSPGFVSNRVLMLTVNEAIYLVHDQVAAPE